MASSLVSCDTFVALPPATNRGFIVFGKNSDRPRGEVQEVRHFPAATHEAGTKLQVSHIICFVRGFTAAVLGHVAQWVHLWNVFSHEIFIYQPIVIIKKSWHFIVDIRGTISSYYSHFFFVICTAAQGMHLWNLSVPYISQRASTCQYFQQWTCQLPLLLSTDSSAAPVRSVRTSRSSRRPPRTPWCWAVRPGCGVPRWAPMSTASVWATRPSGPGCSPMTIRRRNCSAWTWFGEWCEEC